MGIVKGVAHGGAGVRRCLQLSASFPLQAGLFRSRRALVLSGSLGCVSESHQARPLHTAPEAGISCSPGRDPIPYSFFFLLQRLSLLFF